MSHSCFGDIIGLAALFSAALLARQGEGAYRCSCRQPEVADVVEVPLTTRVMVTLAPETGDSSPAHQVQTLHELDEPSDSPVHVAQEGEDEAASQSDEQDPWSVS